MTPFIAAVLADESPNATDLDAAVTMSINAWQTATGSWHSDYSVRKVASGRLVTVDCDDTRGLPRGRGRDIVDAFRDFIRALWSEIDAKSSAAE